MKIGKASKKIFKNRFIYKQRNSLKKIKNQMAGLKKIGNVLSIGAIICFLAALAQATVYVISNRYIQYRMHRIAAFSLQKFLDKWMAFFIILCLFSLLFMLFLWIGKKIKRISFFSNIIIKIKIRMKIFLISILCSIFFILAVCINHFWLYDELHLLSFLNDIEIFILVILLGWLLMKIKWDKIHALNMIKKKEHKSKFLLIFMVCISLFLYVQWNVNHYWSHHRFHLLRLLSQGILLLLIILLGWFLIKIQWSNVFDFKKTLSKKIKNIVITLLILFMIVKIGILIDRKINTPSGKPNIILISIDTLRADHLGCYGYSRNTSPNIDRFSRESIIFTNAITPRPKTTPSMVSVLTGLYPHTHGVRTLMAPLKQEILTLQEILLNKNYKTAAFVGNWVLKKKFSRLDQGFETYDDGMSDKVLNRVIFEKKAPDINKAVFKWLERNHNQGFFLWIHYQDVHGPYIAPEKYQNLFRHHTQDLVLENLVPRYQKLPWIKSENGYVDVNSYKDAYDSEIRFCDEYIGHLFKKLNDLRLTNTIIILTADHGESLGEHNYYFEHGSFVYDVCSRVPLLIYVPGIEKMKVIKQQVNIMNITPTILDLLGYSESSSIEGISLLPLMKGATHASDDYIFIERRNRIKAVRTDTFKYINNLYNDTEELYHIKKDPYEKNNIILEHEEVADGLNIMLHRWMNYNDGVSIKKLRQDVLNEEAKEALKSLGYIQY